MTVKTKFWTDLKEMIWIATKKSNSALNRLNICHNIQTNDLTQYYFAINIFSTETKAIFLNEDFLMKSIRQANQIKN